MVVILQQTSDSGNKFISTVVDATQDASINNNNSGFSLNSQLSISERSVAYKQRIDSLFNRPARLNTGNFRGEPFRIRVDGKSLSPTQGITPSSSNINSSTAVNVSCSTLKVSENASRVHSTYDDDDDYARIIDKTSIVTDSLNHRVKVSTAGPSQKVIAKRASNISSVRITCDESEGSGSQHHSLMLTSSSSEEAVVGQTETGGSDRIMWRNSNYGETSPGNPGSRTEKPFSTIRCSPAGMLKFAVEYLGSVPVKGNTAALNDLQVPLRSLYMKLLTNTNVMTGQLAITSDGLRFEAPKVRLVNPFTTIAVWAAVKFVGRGEPIANECAFMPLISDPEGQDKSRLFGKMDADLATVYHSLLKEPKKTFKNPPIFACVMREASFSLECHAFACKCAEDAIVIAANLYQSLVDKMRAGREGESGYGSLTRGSPTTHSSINQNRSSSSASSVVGPKEEPANDVSKNMCPPNKTALAPTSSSSSTQQDCRAVFSDSESIVPVRPPRKKKKASEIPLGNLKRYNSDDSVLLNVPYRRRSFKASHQGHYIKHKKRVQIHTPEEDDSSADSFSDSIDQVLDRIVNPCGMSFNDLKPSHQELILKIALTLTQDQLYKKSKQAMKKQQQKYRKKQKSTASAGEVSDDNTQFMSHFLKSISKISLSGKAVPIPKRSTLVNKTGFGVNSRIKQQKVFVKPQIAVPSKAILKKTRDDDIPFMSFCSGCACEKCSEKCYCSLPSKHANNDTGDRTAPTTSTSTTATSTPVQHPICSSAADTDVTRSRKSCGYDTDSCAESEKCYCSLQRVKSNGLKIYNINLDTETSDTDTNSYDLEHFNNPHLSEMAVSTKLGYPHRPVEILSYHPSRRLSYCFSPPTAQKFHSKNGSPTKNVDHDKPCSSKNLVRKFRDLNVLDNPHLSKNKVLLITGSNASGQVVYKDSPFNLRQGLDFSDGIAKRMEHVNGNSNQDIGGQESQTPEDEERPCSSLSVAEKKPEFAPERVLSMKKSAEIAAMFTDLKLSPATNFILNSGSEVEELGTHQETTSIDFETSLGYLP